MRVKARGRNGVKLRFKEGRGIRSPTVSLNSKHHLETTMYIASAVTSCREGLQKSFVYLRLVKHFLHSCEGERLWPKSTLEEWWAHQMKCGFKGLSGSK